VKKIAQNVCSPNCFFEKMNTDFSVEKSSTKIWGTSVIFKMTTQRKQSPNLAKIRPIWRKFAQSGHPVARLSRTG
jgi:hypothetical protein